MNLKAYLAEREADYDDSLALVGAHFYGPGYHSHVPSGMWAHQTRDSLDYAVLLLKSGEKGYIERAERIIAKVISLQETDPTKATYGIWSWLYEEPLDKMAPPDWNWADFCGAQLAMALKLYAELLSDGLKAQIREALGHAGWSIFRRNVGPNYTNIAFMGATVTSAAGEMADEPRLLTYGRQRFANIVRYTKEQGGLNEYNSPTYTLVALHECERALMLVEDKEVRESAETMRRFIWESLAEHFHPATGQLAGPYSRVYGDWMFKAPAAYLSEQTGAAIAVRDDPTNPKGKGVPASALTHLPCPEDIAERFTKMAKDEECIRRCFVRRGESENDCLYGTTWMNETACLGSINQGFFWVQCRPVLGYWRTQEDQAVMLRACFMHDGKDFSSAHIRTAQHDNRVITAVGLVTNKGDYHCHLDAPEDAVFEASDLRLRYELKGKGATVTQLDEGCYELRAGDYRAVVRTAAGEIDGQAVGWEMMQEEDHAAVDAVFYHGAKREIPFKDVKKAYAGAAIEMLSTEAQYQSGKLVTSMTDERWEAECPEDAALKVSIPVGPIEYVF